MINDIVQKLAEKYKKTTKEVFEDFKREYRIVHRVYPYADKEHKKRLGLYILETKYNDKGRKKRFSHDEEKE